MALDETERNYLIGFIALLVSVFGIGLIVEYRKADVQRAVYERQGVHMTTWEVFMGAKPVERVIQIKE